MYAPHVCGLRYESKTTPSDDLPNKNPSHAKSGHGSYHSSPLVFNHDIHVSFIVITTNEASAAQDELLKSPILPPGLDMVYLPPVDVSAVTTEDTPVVARISAIVNESIKSLKSVLIELGKLKAVVIDLFCTRAFDICRELSVPAYLFFTASIALFNFSLYLPTLDREVEGEFVDLPEPVKVPGCPPIRTEDLLDQVRNRKIDEYRWYLFHSIRFPLGAGIFLNSWEDLEPANFKAITEDPFFKEISTPPVHPVGPLVKQEESLTASDAECLAWLDRQPTDSVLFVALGSGGTLTVEQLTELAWGLELSHRRFIFVVRTPTNTSALGVFFNVGSDINDAKAYLPEGFLERTRERGIVVPSWAPQVAILKHPSTGGFLCYCGWNSVLESVTYGVPMIAWPLYAEQRMNATILSEQLGIAIKAELDPETSLVRREEVERVIRLVMEGKKGKEMKKKTRELKESAAKALEKGGPSYGSLARLAAQWKA